MDDTIKIINNLASKIVNRGLAVPAIFFLESTKYITFIGSQFLVFLGPIATCFINNNKYYNIAEILEDRNNIELLILEIENRQKNNNE
tara:strand:+ start:2137 stop:2400 length:264 start_codon:yes stop_codon:yes gene_type:complete